MKRWTILFSTVILTIPFLQACTDSENGTTQALQKETAGIILSHNTSVRISPFIFSARITRLEKGESVRVKDRSSVKTWIGKSSNYWYRVALKNGMTGWVFGNNLKILNSGKEDDVKAYVSRFWEKETEELKKELKGKWWSINRFGDFTWHGLEIYENGTYSSYRKGGEKYALKGEYNFDLAQNEIVFLKGTTFKSNLNYTRRGQSYLLHTMIKEKELRFKKIQAEISPALKKEAAEAAKNNRAEMPKKETNENK